MVVVVVVTYYVFEYPETEDNPIPFFEIYKHGIGSDLLLADNRINSVPPWSVRLSGFSPEELQSISGNSKLCERFDSEIEVLERYKDSPHWEFLSKLLI